MKRGFSLLEVIVSVMILAIALVGFVQGQASSIRMSQRAERMGQAIELAQQKMTETEQLVQAKGFESLLEEEKGEFEEEALKSFTWLRKIERVDMGCFFPQGSSSGEAEGGMFNDQFLKMGADIMDASVRKITISVFWTEGQTQRSVELPQIYVRRDQKS